MKLRTQGRLALALLATVIAMLAAPTGTVGELGADVANAADPRGNWILQFRATRSHAWHACAKSSNQAAFGACRSVSYAGSGSHGSRSRFFVWNIYFIRARCKAVYYIGRSNYVFAKKNAGCVSLLA